MINCSVARMRFCQSLRLPNRWVQLRSRRRPSRSGGMATRLTEHSAAPLQRDLRSPDAQVTTDAARLQLVVAELLTDAVTWDSSIDALRTLKEEELERWRSGTESEPGGRNWA